MSKEIKLTQGQVAIVCDCHAHLVEGHKWCAVWDKKKKQYFAERRASVKERLLGASTSILMHRAINNTPKGLQTDHIDNDSLNNRCSNLRAATRYENEQNRPRQANNKSGYKGVHWHKRDKKWRAHIGVNGKQIALGYFNTAEEASKAYADAAREYHGEFARNG